MSVAKRRARKVLSSTHTWLGLTAGTFFAVLSISGAIIGLKPQIERALFPSSAQIVVCQADPSLHGLEDQIKASSTAPIDRIYFAADADPRVHIRLSSGPEQFQHLIYDSCAGKVLGFAPLGWMDWTIDLHHNFLAAKTGRKVVGLAGILLLVSALAGLGLWFLSNPQWRRVFAIQTQANARRFQFDLHRAIGMGAMIFLLLQAATGIWLAYPQTMRAALGSVVPLAGEGKGMRKPKRKQSTGAVLPLQQYLAAAHQVQPEGRIRELRMSPNGPVSLRFWLPGDVRPSGNNQLLLDRATGSVLQMELLSNEPASSRFIQGITWLHYAEWGGLAARLFSAVGGLTPIVLLTSGFLIWYLPKRKRATVSQPTPQKDLVTAN